MKQHNKIIEKHLKDTFNITVNIDSDWEGVLLSHEEIDPELIKENELKYVPDPALFHMVSYIDEDENEWLFTLASDLEDPQKLFYALSMLNVKRYAVCIYVECYILY